MLHLCHKFSRYANTECYIYVTHERGWRVATIWIDRGRLEAVLLQLLFPVLRSSAHLLTTRLRFTSSTGCIMARRVRYDDAQLLGMLSDVDSSGESDEELDEPMCPGSDDEFPCPDSDDDR